MRMFRPLSVHTNGKWIYDNDMIAGACEWASSKDGGRRNNNNNNNNNNNSYRGHEHINGHIIFVQQQPTNPLCVTIHVDLELAHDDDDVKMYPSFIQSINHDPSSSSSRS